jgi:hypothetical protein
MSMRISGIPKMTIRTVRPNMIQTDKFIYKIEEADTINDLNENVAGPGWYFVDEAGQFNGPHSSRQEALDSWRAYGKHLTRWL